MTSLGRCLVPFVVVAVVVASFASCGTEPVGAGGLGTQNQVPAPDACATPNEGCPCPSPGEAVECGHVKYQSGDYVACSMGTRTCVGDKWGACVGSNIVTKAVPPSFGGGNVTTQAVTQGACPTTGPNANPCDPYCHQIVDDTGINIAPTTTTNCQYYEPADRSASYGAVAASFRANPGNPGPPATCTGGTSDDCGHDARCVSGACSFYAAGETGACVGSWDLTFPTPCDNSGVETLIVCNRGTAPANSGTVSGVMTAASLVNRAKNVSLWKAPTNAARLGTCTINLIATPIAPGTCRDIPLATACPGADLTSGTSPVARTIQWNMPDWTTGDPPRVAGECNTGNNYTVWTQGGLLACQGVGCGATNGSTLQTTVNGESTCPPGPQLKASGTNVCTTANRYTVCQQDFRCENPGTASSQCVWNGGEGWFDPAVAGIDLTIGHPCASPADLFPICNRGSAPVPPGVTVNVHVGGQSPAPNSCALGPATCSAPVPQNGLPPGKCMNVQCSVSGNTYAGVSMTGASEAAGLCANNQTYAKANSSPGCASCTTCDTRVTGKVFDPSAGSPLAPRGVNNLPLAGITVFQPSGPLTPLNDGVACDTCANVASASVVKAVTDATGSFTLSGVTPGPATRIVVQSGRWRREVTVPVTACTNNQPPDGTFRMPRNRTDGLGGVANIPKTAIATGNQESIACMLLKLGISPTEILRRQGSGDAHRFQLYRATNGMATSPAQPNITTLLNTTTLNEYSAVILDCDGGETQNGYSDNATATERAALRSFVDAGGRLFTDHFSGYYALRSAQFPTTAVDTGGNAPSGLPATGRVQVGTFPQQLLSDWLTNVGATFAPRWINVPEARRNLASPVAGTVEWIQGRDNDTWGTGAPPGPPVNASNYTMSYSFETPFNGTCGGGGTGRVIYNGMHVSPGRCSGGSSSQPCTQNFPNNCTYGALTGEEKALIYQFFQLTACQLGGEPPPPPPAAVATTTVTRDFEGICPVGTAPEWQFWRWQSNTPAGTSIAFRAATADTQAALPPGPTPPPSPTTVGAGTATGATVAAPNWANDANTVAWHLANDPAGRNEGSKRWLRVYMTFNPIGAVAPVLTGFRQDYSCVPAE